ncbi:MULTISPECIES: hypothetical protein [Streptomyces]|uniref:hypothetical protein n=1 Tax=Streptomyces TaxID=1883 RepID=UPI0021016726|nr:hypothetical protein [Streptomyces parvus]MCQ1580367.1 hypothetical protein [Streptomyces parvus]
MPLPLTSQCRNRHCGDRLVPRPDDTPDTYCLACVDLADDHDQGEHDHDSHEHCPACQP